MQSILLDQPLVSDRITNIVMILFVLSLIAERLANFIKLNFPEESDRLNKMFGVDFLAMKTRSDDPSEEKKREKRMMWVALFSGFMIALAFKANLIDILQSPNGGELGWDETPLWKYSFFDAFKLILGCVLTGFFISMGSKFWHDLLDIVLAIKNTKNKLADAQTYSQPSADAVEEYLNTSYEDIVDKAINKYTGDLAKLGGVVSFANKETDDGKNVLHIRISDASVADQLPHFRVALASGRMVNVPFETEVAKIGRVHSGPGSLILSNSDDATKLNRGAFGCVVKKKDSADNKTFLLTCYHVVKLSKDDWKPPAQYDNPNELIYASDPNKKTIAIVRQTQRDDRFDVAFAELTDAGDNSAIGIKPQVRTLTRDDARKHLPLKMKSSVTEKERNGKLQYHKISARLAYDDQNIFLLNDLIAVSDSSYNTNYPMSAPGDSGSILMDANGMPCGMIVGADDNYSYAIPLERILGTFNYAIV